MKLFNRVKRAVRQFLHGQDISDRYKYGVELKGLGWFEIEPHWNGVIVNKWADNVVFCIDTDDAKGKTMYFLGTERDEPFALYEIRTVRLDVNDAYKYLRDTNYAKVVVLYEDKFKDA